MDYSSVTTANTLLKVIHQANHTVSPTKLNLLLFLTECIAAQRYGFRFSEYSFWKHTPNGPLNLELSTKFHLSSHGPHNNIRCSMITRLIPIADGKTYVIPTNNHIELQVLEVVASEYVGLTEVELYRFITGNKQYQQFIHSEFLPVELFSTFDLNS